MQLDLRVGGKVAVDIGGCAGNRAEGVIASIKERPGLTTYEVRFPEFGDGAGIERFYMAEYLMPVG